MSYVIVEAATPPSRIFTYISGSQINPDEVTANEDAIFNYLNRDTEELADGSVTTSKILDGTIVNADISSSAAIGYSKLNLSNSVAASDIASTTVTAGSYTTTDLTVDADGRITTASNGTVSLTSEVSGTLPVGNGGTGATAAANAANGVVVPTGAVNAANGAVVLNASSQLPAVDGSLLTGLSNPSPKGMEVFTSSGTWHFADAGSPALVRVICIGGGGEAGAAGTGGTGGTSSFVGSAVTVQATGGVGGSASGGVGGTGSGGSLNFTGISGLIYNSTTLRPFNLGTNGGIAGGFVQKQYGLGGESASENKGGGGGGGYSEGVVAVTGDVTVTVGTGGTGGGAGTDGTAGIVIVYW